VPAHYTVDELVPAKGWRRQNVRYFKALSAASHAAVRAEPRAVTIRPQWSKPGKACPWWDAQDAELHFSGPVSEDRH